MGDKLIKVNFGQGLGKSLIKIVAKVNVRPYYCIDSTATYNWLIKDNDAGGSAKKFVLIQKIRRNQSIFVFEYDTRSILCSS